MRPAMARQGAASEIEFHALIERARLSASDPKLIDVEEPPFKEIGQAIRELFDQGEDARLVSLIGENSPREFPGWLIHGAFLRNVPYEVGNIDRLTLYYVASLKWYDPLDSVRTSRTKHENFNSDEFRSALGIRIHDLFQLQGVEVMMRDPNEQRVSPSEQPLEWLEMVLKSAQGTLGPQTDETIAHALLTVQVAQKNSTWVRQGAIMVYDGQENIGSDVPQTNLRGTPSESKQSVPSVPLFPDKQPVTPHQWLRWTLVALLGIGVVGFFSKRKMGG